MAWWKEIERALTLQTALDCYPCFFRQALQAAREVTDDPAVHQAVMRSVSEMCTHLDADRSPPAVGQQIHRAIRAITGQADPYRKIKQRFNDHAVALREQLRQRVGSAEDPFDAAIRLSIAGNRIDFGARSDVSEQEISDLTDQAAHQVFNGELHALKAAVERSERLLFLADNAGEIALDMLLIEQLPTERVTVAVRGGPVINDATMADAQAVGLNDMVRVIDNGSDAPGTLLDDCSPAFRDAFDQADLILAKGQGNYESLSDLEDDRLYFLLIPKCALVAGHLGCGEGQFVVRSGKETTP
jgi:hypothetical protein